MLFLKLRPKKTWIFILIASFISSFLVVLTKFINNNSNSFAQDNFKKIIKYVEFNPSIEALEIAMNEDISSYNTENHINWIKILAIFATENGGDFKKIKQQQYIDTINKIKEDNIKIKKILKTKLYSYYEEAYTAVLSEFLGKYNSKNEQGEIIEKYGLKVFSPIAKTFPYHHYFDFGAIRNYGYSRPHLGHDIMCVTGTPVVAIEGGIVEIMGWNQYGGWRIGIRSFDKKRYYYYAHLRKNKPFNSKLKIGDTIEAGEVIGYVGRTGYSSKENVNNISKSHLHLGIQLIFDESQKECNNEIWIDLYAITKLLEKNRSSVKRDEITREFFRE